MTRIIQSLSDISNDYDALFCDLWGVIHNGREVFPAAVDALQSFRRKGGRVVLLTNAPRPFPGVKAQLARLGAPADCYDLIVTSGDASQNAVAAGLYGKRIYHVGPDRDFLFFDDHNGQPLDVTRVSIEEADAIICTGLWDDQTETPDDYRHLILNGLNRQLTMLCANPDIEVDHGDKRIYCAGAVGAAYAEAGGTVHYYGKPHSPIYQLSSTLLTQQFGVDIPKERILAVGDGILTDVPGAIGENIDCLFVAGGLAAEQIGIVNGDPNVDGVRNYLDAAGLAPKFTIGYFG